MSTARRFNSCSRRRQEAERAPNGWRKVAPGQGCPIHAGSASSPRRLPCVETSQNRGFLLLAVLVIVMLASMVAISLIFRLRAEQASFASGSGSEQAWAAAMSGVQQAIYAAQSSGNNSANWQNNPGIFFHQLVLDDVTEKWYYTIYTQGTASEPGPRYGLTDEAGKVNIKKIDPATLQKILGLASDTAPSEILAHSFDGSMTEAPTNAAPFALGPEVQGFSTLDDLL